MMYFKREVDLPLYKTTLSSHIKKKIVRKEVNTKTINLAELFINQLSQPKNGSCLKIRKKKVIIVRNKVSLKI